MTDARADERRAAVAHRWRPLSRIDDPFVRAVARLPVTVRTKLLIAFVGTSMLLVAVGLLGQLVLGQSNDRVGSLGPLRERVIAYGQLQRDVGNLRQLMAQNVGGEFCKVWTGGECSRENAEAIDRYARTAVRVIEAGTAADQLLFTPPREDRGDLEDIRATAHQLWLLLGEELIPLYEEEATVEEMDHVRAQAEDLLSRLKTYTANLADGTRAEVDELIARNESSFASSRALFIGVAAGALVLALFLGFILSRSLVGSIQDIDGRLAAIASGNFEGHVDVENRDELGALAANVNRMNDELRSVYAKLEAASQHKSEFLANMSHELRTPLNAIIGFSQVLRDEMVGSVNDKQSEYLDDIISSGNHLLSLINDVLDLSKVEAGQVELDVHPFSLREALERGVVMVRERATGDGVRVAFAADPEVDVVDGDERRIKQVIFNLLSNAVKFTPAGGEVDVSATRANGEVRVSVADTGPGVAPEDRERIFEEFQQSETGGVQHEGTGLGLALSKRFVELHGGRIWLESEVGRGSTFTFALPTRSSPA
ncbi:MAG: HAMP domain-containing histidine kinase [Actinobacteria bacterium]|nr:HAMP domain-containing histidine kinase [Actinomycetota bacterium]